MFIANHFSLECSKVFRARNEDNLITTIVVTSLDDIKLALAQLPNDQSSLQRIFTNERQPIDEGGSMIDVDTDEEDFTTNGDTDEGDWTNDGDTEDEWNNFRLVSVINPHVSIFSQCTADQVSQYPHLIDSGQLVSTIFHILRPMIHHLITGYP
jgi:hypothetical protein